MFTMRFTMRSAAADPGARADSYAAMLDMVLDCVNAGFEVVVPRDAVAGVPPDYAEAVVDNTLRLPARVERTDEAGRLGRTEPLDVCTTPFSHPHFRDRLEPMLMFAEAAELAEIGVTWLALRLPAPDLATFLRNVERLGSQIAR